MKLLNNMFMVEQYDAAGARFTIGLNAEHVIYRAHFPGHAVTPGVCIIQLLMELAEQRLQRPLRLRRVKNLKFIDRKSTRLNSSHANISYAVFCLKKKKNSIH